MASFGFILFSGLSCGYRTTSMQASTQLHMTSLTISARWRQTTIRKSLIYWTTVNIQVLHFPFNSACVFLQPSVYLIFVKFLFCGRYRWAEAFREDLPQHFSWVQNSIILVRLSDDSFRANTALLGRRGTWSGRGGESAPERGEVHARESSGLGPLGNNIGEFIFGFANLVITVIYALLSSKFHCFFCRIVSTTSTSITRSMQGRDSSSTGRRNLRS